MDHAHVVAHKQHCPALAARDIVHLSETLLLKVGVADRQHFVDDEDVRLEMRRHRETEAYMLPACARMSERLEVTLWNADDIVGLNR